MDTRLQSKLVRIALDLNPKSESTPRHPSEIIRNDEAKNAQADGPPDLDDGKWLDGYPARMMLETIFVGPTFCLNTWTCQTGK